MWLTGDYFYSVSMLLTAIEHAFENSTNENRPIAEAVRKLARAEVANYVVTLTKLGSKLPLMTAKRWLRDIESPNCTHGVMRAFAQELHGRLRDELASTCLWSVPQEANRFLKKQPFGEDVDRQFGRVASKDIEEASKCLALGRSTASVFHLMRVMEIGLRALGETLSDPRLDPKKNPSWEKKLARGDEEMKKQLAQRSPAWQADEGFFSTAHANLRAVKNAWRNPTMHIERDYDLEEAEDVWNAVRAVMRHLSQKLSS